MDFESANDEGGVDDTLRPAEALDSDEVRNDDGDNVVDPPDEWIDVERSDSLDEKLAAEVPDTAEAPAADDASAGDTVELSDDQIDHVVPGDTGTDEGQISGTPEDGDSFFTVVE